MQWLHSVDFIATLVVLSILALIWFYHFRKVPRIVWRCYRYQGGGEVRTPRPMTLQEATAWLGDIGCEVSYTDLEHGFIFYRPRGGA